MVTLLLGQRADAIGKVQGLGKIGKTKNPFEPWNAVHFRQRPFRDLWFQLLNIRFSYSR